MGEQEHDWGNVWRGAVLSSEGKTRITIYLDDDVLDHFREVATAAGRGYQTIINRTLRAAMERGRPREVASVVHVVVPAGQLQFSDWLQRQWRTP